jgi:hypothetical protein
VSLFRAGHELDAQERDVEAAQLVFLLREVPGGATIGEALDSLTGEQRARFDGIDGSELGCVLADP